MQTRTRARAALPGTSFPCIPGALQLVIVDNMIATYPEPDTIDYTLYPFKSTLGWLLSLRLVNRQWCQHMQQHPVLTARCRLEVLRNLSLLHDYAHYIVTNRRSKKKRIKAVPRKITLRFEDDSSSCFGVPKGLNKAEQAGGLPSNTLMLVAAYNQVTPAAFKQLLADLDCLDQRHTAPMVLKVITSSTGNIRQSTASSTGSDQHTTATVDVPAAATAGTAVSVDGTLGCFSSAHELIEAAKALLQQQLVHVVMEGTSSSPALYFLPTKQGFCRRVPAASGNDRT